MPQFDTITFFNQVFYFTLIFTIFYLIILKMLLPKISFILKTRQKFAPVFVFKSNTFSFVKLNDLIKSLVEKKKNYTQKIVVYTAFFLKHLLIYDQIYSHSIMFLKQTFYFSYNIKKIS